MTNISINKLHEFRDHPYQVLDNEEMNSLIESVQQQGIMTPLIVRPLEGTTDEYEIISGHRRYRAAQKAGLAEVPAFIRPVSRDEAAIMVVDSNLHREHILPSEKAYAYKLKLEAMSRQGSTVIVKDLSRLGRRYDMVGYYMDTYFPDRDVRFIAVNDNIDSDEGESEIAPFKNVLNEFYARDISKKCRSSYRIRGSTGEPLAPPPYGYIKSPDNPKKWVIDPEAAQVVRDIFKMALEGKSNETIARILQERKVLIPMAYWQEKGIRKGGKVTQPNKYKWCKTTVTKILTQQEYCGDIINFKTYSKSYKNKKRYDNPKENWVFFKDVHEPIINRDDFELVQTLVVKTKRRAPKKENGEKNMFCDFLYCADCGSKLWYHTNTNNKEIHFFSCSNYKKDTRGNCETRHYIRADAIERNRQINHRIALHPENVRKYKQKRSVRL